jgi:hypothetical protein
MLPTKLANRSDVNDIEFRMMSDEEMLAEIRRRTAVCSQSFVDLANIVGPAIRRGIDLRGVVRPPLLDVLRKIESGQILPELAQCYMQTDVFWKLRNLPVDDQRMIVETGTVEVAFRHGDKFDTRKLPVTDLTSEQRGLVFCNGRIRSQSEMIAILEDRMEPEEDPYPEAIVSFKIPSVAIDMTKADANRLKEYSNRSGGMAELVKHAIKKMIG